MECDRGSHYFNNTSSSSLTPRGTGSCLCEGIANRPYNFRSMEPLDLSNQPPRAPRAELDGIVFLPRSIDKARAHLPGGNRNEYGIPGVTGQMLERFGVSHDDFVAAVGAAASETEIVAFVRRHASQATIDAWNTWVNAREPRGNRDLPEVHETYPWLKERPDLRLALDILAEDDRRFYARSV
jgi:hypothetical protein